MMDNSGQSYALSPRGRLSLECCTMGLDGELSCPKALAAKRR